MVMKRKTFFRIVAALSTAAVILGAIDVHLIGRLRELDVAPAVQAVRSIQAVRPSSPSQISVEEDEQDAEEGGSCHSAPEVVSPPKENPLLKARME